MNYLVIIAALIGLSGSAIQAQEVLKLAGSTTCQKGFVEPSQAEAEQELGIKLDVVGGGSTKGIEACMAGTAGIGMSSRPLKPEETAGGAVGRIVGWDAIAVIVHKDNPVTSLSKDQLKDLNTGKIANWKDVGGPDLPVVVVTSHKGAATRDMFQELAMDKAAYVKTAVEVLTTRLEVEKVCTFKGGIGAVSMVFADQAKVRIVPVNGVAPEHQSVVSGTYPLSRPLVLVTKGEPTGAAGKYVNWILGAKGQEWIAKSFIAVSEHK